MSEKKKYQKRKEKKDQNQKEIDEYMLKILCNEEKHTYSSWHPYSKVTFTTQIGMSYLVYRTKSKKICRAVFTRMVTGVFLHLFKEEKKFFIIYEFFASSSDEITLRVEVIPKSKLGNKEIIFSKNKLIYVFNSKKFSAKQISLINLL